VISGTAAAPARLRVTRRGIQIVLGLLWLLDGLLAPIGAHLAALVPGSGVSIVVDLIVLQAFVGIGALRAPRVRLAAVIVGSGLLLAYWVAGQGIGRPGPGLATDPGTAPLMVLLGFAVLGSASWRRPAGEPDQSPAVLDELGAR
jgi:hypothetical protein